MDDGDLAGDQLQISLPAGAVGNQLLADGGVIQPGGNAHHNGCAHRAEGHRRALHQHAHQHRRHGREADSNQQRRSNGSCSTKTGGTFNEATKQPGNDDRLDTRIRTNGGKARADHGDATRMFKRIE